MGNTQQGGQRLQETASSGGMPPPGGGSPGAPGAPELSAGAAPRRRRSTKFSTGHDAEDEITLDGDFVATGVPTHRPRKSTLAFLGARGDLIAAGGNPMAAHGGASGGGASGGGASGGGASGGGNGGRHRRRVSTVPQQVVKFERVMVSQGNIFAGMSEELKALLGRESPSVRNKLTSSGNIPLGHPLGRVELARQHIAYGSNYFPVHAPRYFDTCPASEKTNLQVLEVSKRGLTLHSGDHYSHYEWGGVLGSLDPKKLKKRMGNRVQHWPLSEVAQWRVMEYHFSFRYRTGNGDETRSYTVESAECASIGKTLEAHVAGIMKDLRMDTTGVFTPEVDAYDVARVRGDHANLQRKKSISGPVGGHARRRSSFSVNSPLKGTRKKVEEAGAGAGAAASGRSGMARRRNSINKANNSGNNMSYAGRAKDDHGITVISGSIDRRSGGVMGFNKKFKPKFYALYETSQGHFLCQFAKEEVACLPQNPRAKWKWPKSFVDLSTTLRVYSPSVADEHANPCSMDIVCADKIWTFQFANAELLGRWLRRISAAVRADALIVPDRHQTFFCGVHRRLADRDVYGDRKTQKIGEAQVTLKCLDMSINFSSARKTDLEFAYWEIMSWRSFRKQASGRPRLALRCVKDREVVELEVECFQADNLDLLEAQLMLFTTKMAAGVAALQGEGATLGVNGKGTGKRRGEPPKRRGGPPKGPKPNRGNRGPVAPPKGPKPNRSASGSRSSAGDAGGRGGRSGSGAQLQHMVSSSGQSQSTSARNLGKKKKGAKKKGKAKGGGIVRGTGARRRPSMGRVL